MIAALNIAYKNGAKQILQEMSLTLPSSGFVAVIGPNGAGKTSLLHVLSGLSNASGEVLFGGKPVKQWKPTELAKKRAYLQQQHSVFESFTVMDVLLMGRTCHYDYYPTEADRRLVMAMLADLQLTERKDQVFNSLSGGEQQRVQFARTLLQLQDAQSGNMHGKVLFLDEPLNNLDLHYQYGLLQMAKDKVSEQGGLIIAVLHDLNIAYAFADRVIMLQNGKLAAFGETEEVMEASHLTELYKVPITKIEAEGSTFFHVQPSFLSARPGSKSKEIIYA